MSLDQKLMLFIFVSNIVIVVVYLIQKLIEQEEKSKS